MVQNVCKIAHKKSKVKKKIEEISPGLPSKTLEDGTQSQLTIVPFYDRSGLIIETLGTLENAVTQQILVTIIVVLLMVLHLRSAALISSILPLAVLFSFIGMSVFGVDANVVALSGIAIAIGTIALEVGEGGREAWLGRYLFLGRSHPLREWGIHLDPGPVLHPRGALRPASEAVQCPGALFQELVLLFLGARGRLAARLLGLLDVRHRDVLRLHHVPWAEPYVRGQGHGRRQKGQQHNRKCTPSKHSRTKQKNYFPHWLLKNWMRRGKGTVSSNKQYP